MLTLAEDKKSLKTIFEQTIKANIDLSLVMIATIRSNPEHLSIIEQFGIITADSQSTYLFGSDSQGDANSLHGMLGEGDVDSLYGDEDDDDFYGQELDALIGKKPSSTSAGQSQS